MQVKQQEIFEKPAAAEKTRKAVNVASVPQRSPFRYPGGKTWFVPDLRRWMQGIERPQVLVEPFAGGGIIGITAACENLVDHVVMVERDPLVAAAWDTILNGGAEWLADRILNFELSVENAQAVLDAENVERWEEGFRTILRNRINHGGIMAPGCGMLKHGESGKGIASRWYPETLARRLRVIDAVRDRITFIEGDGMDVMDRYLADEHAAYFIDPPYTAGKKGKRAGNRLYAHSELDHDRLFNLAATARGDFLMTYDDDVEVLELAETRGLKVCRVPMKGTHHRETMELVITPAGSNFC